MQFEFKINGEPCTVVVTDYTLGDEDFFECDYKVYDPDQEELKPQFISDFFHDWIVDEILDKALEEEKQAGKDEIAYQRWERKHAQY